EQGDEYAFRALFVKYQKRLALLIHYKLGHEMRRLADVEDVLQETFLEAFRDIKRFRYEKPGGFLSWLSRIADHVIADAARFHGRQRGSAEFVRSRWVGPREGPEPVDSATPSRLLAEKESGNARLLFTRTGAGRRAFGRAKRHLLPRGDPL